MSSELSVCLAPMVGLTHYAVRAAMHAYLPPGHSTLWPTEMLSSRRLPSQAKNAVPEVYFHDVDHGLVPQLLGNDERFIRESVKKLEDWGARAIDINMGCPVQKALKHNYGVSLMGDADYAASVVEMTVRNTKLPVSVKLRSGLQNDPQALLKFTRGLENAGAAWLALHPRTATQKRRGRADWSQIALIKQSLGIPVFGNGDVQCAEDALAMKRETGCDRVMVGRALLARPWLFAQVAAADGSAAPDPRTPSTPEEEGAEYGRFVRKTLELTRQHYPEAAGLRRMKFFVHHGAHWLQFGHTLTSRVRAANGYEDLTRAFDEFFAQPQKMQLRTDLRL